MKYINVTILCAGMEGFPSCSDLLQPCRAVSIIAQPESIHAEGAGMAISRCDILILDEATLVQDGVDSLRGLLARQPLLKSLLIVEKYSENNILSALSLGISGVILKGSLFSELTRAVTAVYLGEAWVSRGLVEPIRNELVYRDRMAHWAEHSLLQPGWDTMH